MKEWNVVVLPGDGIGPELVEAAMPIIEAVNEKFGIKMKIHYGEAGFNCIKKYGTNLPKSTIALIKKSSCTIKGPMTTPEEPGSDVSVAVKLRKMFELYADVRPVRTLPGIPDIKQGVDLVIVRENTEGMYSGLDFKISKNTAVGIRVITRKGSERVGKFALELARKRKKHLTIVHKANILKVSDGLFIKSIMAISKKYKDVRVDEAHADAMAQWLIKKPEEYDVLVMENMFGDILSDEASMLVGGIGTGASGNIGDRYAMFEPIHGSAPKYKGLNKADPIGVILSAKMMYDWMGYGKAARLIQNSAEKCLKRGRKTYDLGGRNSTSEVGRSILKNIEKA